MTVSVYKTKIKKKKKETQLFLRGPFIGKAYVVALHRIISAIYLETERFDATDIVRFYYLPYARSTLGPNGRFLENFDN